MTLTSIQRIGLLIAATRLGTACEDHSTSLGRHPASVCASMPPADLCNEVPALAADPVIDGKLECGLSPQALPRTTWRRDMILPAEISAEIAVAWRPQGLYVYVHVTEPQRDPAIGNQGLFCGDTTHISIDDDGVYPNAPNFGPTGTRQFLATAPGDDRNPVSRGRIDIYPNIVGDWDIRRFRTFPTPDGYVLEAFITGAEMALPNWVLKAGGRVGVGAIIGIGDGVTMETSESCPKKGDLSWKIATQPFGQCWSSSCNTTAFCSPVLLPAP